MGNKVILKHGPIYITANNTSGSESGEIVLKELTRTDKKRKRASGTWKRTMRKLKRNSGIWYEY